MCLHGHTAGVEVSSRLFCIDQLLGHVVGATKASDKYDLYALYLPGSLLPLAQSPGVEDRRKGPGFDPKAIVETSRMKTTPALICCRTLEIPGNRYGQ